MGDRMGINARSRITLFASLNLQFSPRYIQATKQKFDAWLKDNGWSGDADTYDAAISEAILAGRFLDFARHLGCTDGWMVDEGDHSDEQRDREHERLVRGVNRFEPGTFDLVSMVVFRNLSGRFPNIRDDHPMSMITELYYPRPMVFERAFGDKEEVVIRSTQYGIKVTLQSLSPQDTATRGATRMKHRCEVGFVPTEFDSEDDF